MQNMEDEKKITETEKFYHTKWNIPVRDEDGYYSDLYKHTPIEMIKFAQAYHQSKLKNHSDLSNVSDQRELLNNFSSWLNEQYKLNIPPDEYDVSRYLKNYQ